MDTRRMDPRQQNRVMMQQQALMRSQLTQAATVMPPEQLNSYVLSWHGPGGGPQHGGRAGAGPGHIPSLSSGQGFYTVESLQGATAMPMAHNGPGLLGMGGPMLQPGFDSHHQLPVVMHPMLGHKVLANGMGFPQGPGAGGMVRMPGPEPPHMFGNGPPPHRLFLQNRLPQGYAHARCDVAGPGPLFFPRERERDRIRSRDRDRDRDRDRERSRDRGRLRERERDRDRERERDRDRDRERERDRGRDRDRDYDHEQQDRDSRQLEKFNNRSKKGHNKQASPPLSTELPASKPPSSSGKAKRKQASGLGPGGPGWCSLCQVECNTEEMLEQHVAGKRHKRHLQKMEGDQEGAKKKSHSSSESKLGHDMAGDSDLLLQERADSAKKNSTDDAAAEHQTAKKPRVEDCGSEIGTLDVSSTMETEQSTKLNEVCSRLHDDQNEYGDDDEGPAENYEIDNASQADVEVVGGSTEWRTADHKEEDAAEDVDSEAGNILDNARPSVAIQDLDHKPACHHTEVSGCKDFVEQALSLDDHRFDLENSGDDKVLDSDEDWNEEGVSLSEKLLVNEAVIPDEDSMDLAMHHDDCERNADSEDGLELLNCDDLLPDEDCVDAAADAMTYDERKNQRNLECGTGMLSECCRLQSQSKVAISLCDRSSPNFVTIKEIARNEKLKPVVKLDVEGDTAALLDGKAPNAANVMSEEDVSVDDCEDEFVGSAMKLVVPSPGDCSADAGGLHVGDCGSMYQEDSASSGDTILLGESSIDTEQPFDDEVTLICKEISHCDSLFDEDEEFDDPGESLSVSHAKDVADFEIYTDISNSLHAEDSIDVLDVGAENETARKDEIVVLLGSPLIGGATGNGETAGDTGSVEMFAERVSDSDSSENVCRDGGDAVLVNIVTSGDIPMGTHPQICSADIAADAGSLAERVCDDGEFTHNSSSARRETNFTDETGGLAIETFLGSAGRQGLTQDPVELEASCPAAQEVVQQQGTFSDPAIHAV